MYKKYFKYLLLIIFLCKDVFATITAKIGPSCEIALSVEEIQFNVVEELYNKALVTKNKMVLRFLESEYPKLKLKTESKVVPDVELDIYQKVHQMTYKYTIENISIVLSHVNVLDEETNVEYFRFIINDVLDNGLMNVAKLTEQAQSSKVTIGRWLSTESTPVAGVRQSTLENISKSLQAELLDKGISYDLPKFTNLESMEDFIYGMNSRTKSFNANKKATILNNIKQTLEQAESTAEEAILKESFVKLLKGLNLIGVLAPKIITDLSISMNLEMTSSKAGSYIKGRSTPKSEVRKDLLKSMLDYYEQNYILSDAPSFKF